MASTYDNIIAALLARLATITKANGYRTDAGLQVFEEGEEKIEQADGASLVVYVGDVVDYADESVCIGQEGHQLPIEIEGKIDDAATGAAGRDLKQDIDKALKSDQFFGGLVQEGITSSESSAAVFDAGNSGFRSHVQVRLILSYVTAYGAQ